MKKIKLPITGKTQSLNVSVACGAILYEAVRQKMVGELLERKAFRKKKKIN